MAEDDETAQKAERTSAPPASARGGSRRALAVLVVRLLAIGGLAVSCVLTIGEDRKEARLSAEPKGPTDIASEADASDGGSADADADAKPFEPPPPKSFVFGDASVIDRATKLEWEREPTAERLAWEAAKAHCASLDKDGGGWHLPSRAELMTVLKHWHDPLGGGHDWFWSSDIGVRDGTAWAVGSDSWLNGNPVETKSRVRCVRSARTQP